MGKRTVIYESDDLRLVFHQYDKPAKPHSGSWYLETKRSDAMGAYKWDSVTWSKSSADNPVYDDGLERLASALIADHFARPSVVEGVEHE